MTDWRLRDTMGIVIVFGVILSAAATVDGVAQALIVLVGVVIALLWIANFFFQGYADSLKTAQSDR